MIPMGETRDGRSDYTNFEMDLLDTRMVSQTGSVKKKKKGGPCRQSLLKPSCFPITIVIIFVIMIVLLPIISPDFYEEETPEWEKTGVCKQDCKIVLTESIPENLTYINGAFFGLETFLAWQNLLNLSTDKIDLTAFYWTLRGKDVYEDPSDWQGGAIFDSIANVGKYRKIRIAQNLGDPSQSLDSYDLQNSNLADVRSLNFTKWFGSGVLHTKLWNIDDTHFYIGSANMDWRALTQVKELGVVLYNCSCLARETKKVFDILWEMGAPEGQLPWKWHFKHATKFNATKPLQVYLNGTLSSVYIGSSPPEFCPKGRSTDLSALISVIKYAKKFVYIAVMDYAAAYLYSHNPVFWPDIDDQLKRAAFDKDVEVRLLISQWKHSSRYMFGYLKSLQSFSSSCKQGKILVKAVHDYSDFSHPGVKKIFAFQKIFTVPNFNVRQSRIPFARVNHNKYMVTDNAAYIGTSNWSGDYFNSTAGASIVIMQNITQNSTTPFVVGQLQNIFLRDWNSNYAKPLEIANQC